MTQVRLYAAKTHLSSLVDRAAIGVEVIIAKNGVPMAKLGPVLRPDQPRQPANFLTIDYIAADFDEPDQEFSTLFYGSL